MYYHRINRALRSVGNDIIKYKHVPVKAIIYGKHGEFATASLDMSNLRKEMNRIRDAGRILNAEQILFAGSSPVDDRCLPCSIDASTGKEAITVFSETDETVEITSIPFYRVGPYDIKVGKKCHHLIKDGVVQRIEENDSAAKFYTDKKNDIFSMEAVMH